VVTRDLREWLESVAKCGELKSISGADWKLEMAGLAELACRESKAFIPALLFDEIQGYPKGFRALFNQLNSPKLSSNYSKIKKPEPNSAKPPALAPSVSLLGSR